MNRTLQPTDRMNAGHYELDGPDESGHYERDDCMNADHYKLPLRIVPMATVAWLAAIAPAIAQVPFENELPAPVELAAAQITLDRAAAEAAGQTGPLEGRLYLLVSRRPAPEPRFGPNWFDPEPFFRVDVRGVEAGDTLLVDDKAAGFPDAWSKLPPGEYRVQAVLDHDFYRHHPAHGVGNFYSPVVVWRCDAEVPEPLELVLDQVVEEQPFPEHESIKEVVVHSKLLSAFHGRDVVERAGVALPASYHDEPQRRYPVLYVVPGFGGSHRDALRYAGRPHEPEEGQVEFIRVMLSGDCKWGHHVYADSATNGPRGAALIEEMIPAIDEAYRTVAAATARFLTGHSSGGWSSLWLQVTYPDVFGGVWSSSPDPVDFRDYQQVDLYADPPLSLYFDEQGNRRPIARRGEEPALWYEDFGRMDDCLGRGGQLRSFEAVFSPLGTDGLPRKLWDRVTGRIDPEVAAAWRRYDIRLRIERNWQELGPKLEGKLHVIAGELDTFYLEGAVRKLAETLEQLGSDAQVEIIPGKHHGNVLTPEVVSRIRRQMSQAYLDVHGE
ncbi:MAG: alpha/beta hydrolase-fold protein [Pirellulales bacterium]